MRRASFGPAALLAGLLAFSLVATATPAAATAHSGRAELLPLAIGTAGRLGKVHGHELAPDLGQPRLERRRIGHVG